MKTGCSWLRRFPLLADLSLMRPSGAYPASRRSHSEPLCRVPYGNTWPWVQRLRQQTVITVITAHRTQRTHGCGYAFSFLFLFLLLLPTPLLQFLWVTSTSRAPAPSSGSGGRLPCTALSWCRPTWAAGPWTNTTPSTCAAVRAASLCRKCLSLNSRSLIFATFYFSHLFNVLCRFSGCCCFFYILFEITDQRR